MCAREAVLLTHSKSSHPAALLLSRDTLSVTYLESALTRKSTSIASKELTEYLRPLVSTLAKKPGGEGVVIVN